MVMGEGVVGPRFPVGGVRGEIDAGHIGKGLVSRSEGGVEGRPPLARGFGKDLSCSVAMLQTLRRAGAHIWLMRSIFTIWALPPSLEMRTNSTGHLAGCREALSPFVCL